MVTPNVALGCTIPQGARDGAIEGRGERLLGVRIGTQDRHSKYDTTSAFHGADVEIRRGPYSSGVADSDTNGHHNGHHNILSEWAAERKPIPCQGPARPDASLMNTGVSLSTNFPSMTPKARSSSASSRRLTILLVACCAVVARG